MKKDDIYLPRLIEHTITESMKTNGCVVIEGPKWCGKSTTAYRFAKSVVKLQKPATYNQYKILADIGDDNLLSGEKPLLFDEWQKIPELWDYIRNYIDEFSGKGSFILTGSAKPIEDKERHSGIGRIKKVLMRTMSLWESNESSGDVSLKHLFDHQNHIKGKNNYQLSDIAYLICRGGFPSAVTEKDKNISLNYAKDYVETLISSDIIGVDDIKRNTKRARTILKSYARNISTAATMKTILKDIESNVETQDVRTINSYVDAFTKLFVIDETDSWTPKLRSKTTIRTTSTKHFVDPAIATAILDATPNDLMNDLNTFGLLFENLVIRDLKIYAQNLNGYVYNYRDKSGLEADAVIHLNDGRWGLIEIKIGGEKLINEGANSLKRIKDKIDRDKMNEPSFLAVVTATDSFAYRRSDGVYVIPITCLKQ
ncbi:MAG: DUF4143 domain-containing protein [Acholeplasma sp.]|nr:DUF4143 domain-containing protein [Acholeplasma sp.]